MDWRHSVDIDHCKRREMIIRVRDNIFKRAGPWPSGVAPWALPVGPGPRAWNMLLRTLIIIFLRLQGSMLTKCLQFYFIYVSLSFISYHLLLCIRYLLLFYLFITIYYYHYLLLLIICLLFLLLLLLSIIH